MEAEGQWDLELVILLLPSVTTCPNDAIEIVPIDLAVDVAVIVTSWEAVVALIALHSDKIREEEEASRG